MSCAQSSFDVVRSALAALALAFAARAAAAGEPATYAHAQLGSLSVVSGVLVSRTAADMRGVWNDEHVKCAVTRRLTVRILIDHFPTGKRISRAGRFKDGNCAEGGPNVGFTMTARRAGLACPNGAW